MRRVRFAHPVLILLTVGLLLLALGCGLTPEQRTAFDAWKAQLDQVQAQLAADAARIKEIKEQIQSGQLTPAAGIALLDELYTQVGQHQALLAETQAKYSELKAQGVPWYYQVGSAIGVIATLAASILGVVNKSQSGKLGLVTAAAGVLSRSLDKVNTAEPVGKTVNAELAAQDQVSAQDMRELHHAALAGTI